MSQHTEGPVKVCGGNKIVTVNDTLLVAEVRGQWVKTNQANAKRLALCWNCHDELLAACKRISAAPYGVANGDLDFLNAAIAKAEAQS